MGHSNVRAKVRRRKVAALAAYSRQYSVKNSVVPKTNLNSKNLVTIWHEIRTTRFDTPVYGKTFEIDNDGHYHIIEREFDPTPLLLHHKQPKRLIKWKKRKYSNWKSYSNQHGEKKFKREKRNDFLKYFPNYPYTVVHSSGPAYYEKLVAHKLEKWEKKNPKPNQDLFDKVEDWEQRRFTAEQRFRDFVVSIYDKLPLIGRFKTNTPTAEYMEEKVAEIKDINGDGHKVNEMTEQSPLLKKAKEVTNKVKAKRQNLIVTNLKDHKRQKGRMILPQAA